VVLFVRPFKLIEPLVPLQPVGLTKLVDEITGVGFTTTVVEAAGEVQLFTETVTE
jgi:hypothetical protein